MTTSKRPAARAAPPPPPKRKKTKRRKPSAGPDFVKHTWEAEVRSAEQDMRREINTLEALIEDYRLNPDRARTPGLLSCRAGILEVAQAKYRTACFALQLREMEVAYGDEFVPANVQKAAKRVSARRPPIR
jgi:hypothetical protein